MKNIFSAAVILLLLAHATSCKKETIIQYKPDIKIYGLWQTIQSVSPNAQYIRFNSSNNLSIYSQNALLFKYEVSTLFSPTETQIVADFTGSGAAAVYNYSVSGDTLSITGNNNLLLFKGLKSNSTTPDTWVTNVTSTDAINNLFTDNSRGIGYDGTNLLFADYNAGNVVKVNLATHAMAGTVAVTTSLNTVEFDGSNYWVSSNGYDVINKYSTSGTLLSTSTSMGSWLYGIGYVSPTSIICYSNNEETLYNYNPTTNTITSSIAVDGLYLRDIAVANGKVFIVGSNSIYRINASTLVAEKTYIVPEASGITGIASVGGSEFWLNTNNGAKILKVELN